MTRLAWVAAACVLLAVGVVAADPEPEPARERARTYLILRFVDALELPTQKALALHEVFRQWDQTREDLLRRRATTHEKLHRVLEKRPVEVTTLQTLVADAVALDRELATLPERSFTAAGKLLTVEQQAKLLLLRRDLQGQVHEAVRHRLRAARSGRAVPTPAPAR